MQMNNSYYIFHFDPTYKTQNRIKRRKLQTSFVHRQPEYQSNFVQQNNSIFHSNNRRNVDTYIKFIESKFKNSTIKQYKFPKVLSQEISDKSSIQSMKGTLIYKLKLQNSKKRRQKCQSQIRNRYQQNIMLLKQKIFPRRPSKKPTKNLTQNYFDSQKLIPPFIEFEKSMRQQKSKKKSIQSKQNKNHPKFRIKTELLFSNSVFNRKIKVLI